jgi:hypothetical protein
MGAASRCAPRRALWAERMLFFSEIEMSAAAAKERLWETVNDTARSHQQRKRWQPAPASARAAVDRAAATTTVAAA